MSRVLRIGEQQNRPRVQSRLMSRTKVLTREQYDALSLDARAAIIQELIPLGLIEASVLMEKEVESIAGPWYGRRDPKRRIYRVGSTMGSIVLAGQRLPIAVPRIRDRNRGRENTLKTYQQLHVGTEFDELKFKQVLYGISCRNYELAAPAAAGAMGLSKSTVSRGFVKASAARLKAFQQRALNDLDLVAIFVDGKSFAEDQMIIALGVDMEGRKHVLGFVQAGTENKRAIAAFLRGLTNRGLDCPRGLLAVIDGSKGICAAVRKAFGKRALIQRCHWHKRENILSYLPKQDQDSMRRRLQRAYDRPNYPEARQALLSIRRHLEEYNQSAMNSLDEGFEQTLTLHRLGVFALLGQSFKTTNCLESINALAEERCGKVDHWKNSKQKCRWLAASLMDIEPRLHRVAGHRHLEKLRSAIMNELRLKPERTAKAA